MLKLPLSNHWLAPPPANRRSPYRKTDGMPSRTSFGTAEPVDGSDDFERQGGSEGSDDSEPRVVPIDAVVELRVQGYERVVRARVDDVQADQVLVSLPGGDEEPLLPRVPRQQVELSWGDPDGAGGRALSTVLLTQRQTPPGWLLEVRAPARKIQRRLWFRVLFDGAVTILSAQEGSRRETTAVGRDISASGLACVLTESVAPEIAERVTVEFVLSGDLFRLDAEVVRRRSISADCEIGLVFLDHEDRQEAMHLALLQLQIVQRAQAWRVPGESRR